VKTVANIQEAFLLLPNLHVEDVSEALKNANEQLSEELQHVLCARLNNWLQDYCRDHLWETSGVKPSKLAKRLDQVQSNCERALKSLVNGGEIADLVQASLSVQADFLAEMNGPFEGLPSIEFAAITDHQGRVIATRKNFRGNEKVKDTIAALQLLKDLAQAAWEHERGKVEKAKAKPKHEGDWMMPVLFSRIQAAWIEFFGKIAGAGFNANTEEPDGPCIRFIDVVVQRYREKLPTEIHALAPKLNHALTLTKGAIRSRLRSTTPSHEPAPCVLSPRTSDEILEAERALYLQAGIPFKEPK